MPRFMRGYIKKDTGERTFNHLFHDVEFKTYNEQYAVDSDLPVLFSYPWMGHRYRGGQIVIPKGHIVAKRADREFQRDYMSRDMLPCVTLANGGANVVQTNRYGAAYTRTANVPIGIAVNNIMLTIDGTFEFGYPSIAYDAVIEVPFFGSNAALAQAFNWPAAYNANNLSISNFTSLMSDANGKFIPKTVASDANQKIGICQAVDRNIPIDFLGYVMLEMATSDAGILHDAGNASMPMFDPYNMIQPDPMSDIKDGDRTNGTRSGDLRTDLRKPYQYYANPITNSEMKFYFDHTWKNQLMGLPNLHDGVESGKAQVTENIANGTAGKYAYDAASDITTLTLDHGLIQRDDIGAAFPSTTHPFPSNLKLYRSTDLVNYLQEGVDYFVKRQEGVVVIPATAGTESWRVVYTHLEDVVAGVPSNLNFAGVIGAARIMISPGYMS